MNIEALKSNPLFTQGFARQVEIQKAANNAITEPVKTEEYSSKPAGGANFVQKIKGTNEAAGFISTASKGIEAIKTAVQTGDTSSIMDAATKISFAGRGIMEPQAFDTTNGIVTIDLELGLDKLDLNSAGGKEELLNRLNSASERLIESKKSLSAPINKAEKEQGAKLASMDMSGSEFLQKLNSAFEKHATPAPRGLDALEAKMNEIGNKIF